MKTFKKSILFNEITLTVIICLSIILFAKLNNVVRVSGMSMSPTYSPNELLKTTAPPSNLSVDDIIVFSPPNEKGKKMIKRVVAVEGDTVQIKGGRLYLNGTLVNDKFEQMKEPGIASEKITVPDDHIFVLGDNRNNSKDSRIFGNLPESNVDSIVTGSLLKPFEKNER